MDPIRHSLQSAFDRTKRAMHIMIALFSALVVAHATWMPGQDDRERPQRTNLNVAAIRRIRAAAGISEDSDSFIKGIDTHALAKRKQILVIEQFPGSGQCLAIHVVQNDTSQFRQVWILDREPLDGGGICTAFARSPTVRIGATGEIILNIPSKYIDMSRRVERYVYTWNGHTYILKRHHSVDE